MSSSVVSRRRFWWPRDDRGVFIAAATATRCWNSAETSFKLWALTGEEGVDDVLEIEGSRANEGAQPAGLPCRCPCRRGSDGVELPVDEGTSSRYNLTHPLCARGLVGLQRLRRRAVPVHGRLRRQSLRLLRARPAHRRVHQHDRPQGT
jgi:hypothetical protein